MMTNMANNKWQKFENDWRSVKFESIQKWGLGTNPARIETSENSSLQLPLFVTVENISAQPLFVSVEDGRAAVVDCVCRVDLHAAAFCDREKDVLLLACETMGLTLPIPRALPYLKIINCFLILVLIN